MCYLNYLHGWPFLGPAENRSRHCQKNHPASSSPSAAELNVIEKIQSFTQFDSTQGNSPCPAIVGIDRLIALDFVGFVIAENAKFQLQVEPAA